MTLLEPQKTDTHLQDNVCEEASMNHSSVFHVENLVFGKSLTLCLSVLVGNLQSLQLVI